MSSVAERQRQAKSLYSRRVASETAEIGPPPKRKPYLYKKYRHNLLAFLQECFPHSTGISPFSESHKRAILRIQQIILGGGLELRIVYRGWAKSTIAENAAIWAAGYGHRSFFVLIGADAPAAKIALDSIQSEFETNPRLMAIFPEACWPAQKLEGVPQRAGKQTINGDLTHIQWTTERCVLPTVKGFRGSGAIIQPRGITCNVRGLRFKRPDGRQARPDFVMIDDPQTDSSARSNTQVEALLKILNSTILRLGDHRKQMACVINATVIEPDDMIDRLSSRKDFPAWRTERTPMLLSFAKEHETLWLGDYASIRTTHDPEDDNAREAAQRAATEYYRTRREAMDFGAKASWEHCYDETTEISAIQHAYNILIDTGEAAFMAECQNEPYRDIADISVLTATEISSKISGYRRGEVPLECEALTAFIDVQGNLLYWLVAAWSADFGGYVIDYGSYPDQKGRKYFTLKDARRTLRRVHRGIDEEGSIYAGLDALTQDILAREWQRTDGAAMRIGLCLIDANWGGTTSLVKSFCRQSQHANVIMPSHGRGVKASAAPISGWRFQKGQRPGREWLISKPQGRDIRSVTYDTNYWKKRLHDSLSVSQGGKGALMLFKAGTQDHRMIADHLTSESPTKTESGGRTVYEWNCPPHQENHLFDCAVGSMVAASMLGIERPEDRPVARITRRKKVEYL